MIRFADDDDSKKQPTSQERIAEIRNCLAVILGSTELLLKQEEKFSKEGIRRLEIIKKQVWRIDGLLPKPGK